MDALRRSTLELWQYFEKLSFNTMLYRGPAITHPSVGFYLSLNIQFVVGDLSISGTTPLTIFWARTPGLWQTTELAKHQHISHLYGQVPQVLVIAQLTLSPPAFYLYRRLGAAVFLSEHFHWNLLLAWFSYVAACFLRLPHLPPFGCRSGSGTAFFLYLTIFLICSASSVCPFASSPSCSHEACHLANKWVFPSSHFLGRFPLFPSPVRPHCVTHSEKKKRKTNWPGFSPSPPPSHCHSREVRTVFICFHV